MYTLSRFLGFLEYQQLFSFTPSHHPLKFLPPLSLSPTLPHSFPPLISLFLFLFPFLCTPSLSLSFSLSLLTWPILSFSPFPLSLLSISPSPSLSPSPSSPGPSSLSLSRLSSLPPIYLSFSLPFSLSLLTRPTLPFSPFPLSLLSISLSPSLLLSFPLFL